MDFDDHHHHHSKLWIILGFSSSNHLFLFLFLPYCWIMFIDNGKRYFSFSCLLNLYIILGWYFWRDHWNKVGFKLSFKFNVCWVLKKIEDLLTVNYLLSYFGCLFSVCDHITTCFLFVNSLSKFCFWVRFDFQFPRTFFKMLGFLAVLCVS